MPKHKFLTQFLNKKIMKQAIKPHKDRLNAIVGIVLLISAMLLTMALDNFTF